MTITTSVLVAGIGNIFLGDDGFGPEVLRHVPADLAGSGVRLCDYGIRGLHLAYDLLDGWDRLVLVDALPCRDGPGTLHVFEADPMQTTPGLDAHAMDPAAVFATVHALGGTMPPTVVVGCEVADVAEGIGLSDAVAAAVPLAVRAVTEAVAQAVTDTRAATSARET
ncbi:hydrogenase maturation protease [Mycolicibacterium goodii]|uniref:Peptidase M52 n=1 Tax=Mycolicibacterium goodii TaxID=134601 RepID=A0A0K0XGY2_MYCGD|nr:peptidase M52 [Mycolicibacterium goodii]